MKFLLTVSNTHKIRKIICSIFLLKETMFVIEFQLIETVLFSKCIDDRQGKANNFIIIVDTIIIIKITSDTMESTSGSSVNSKSNSPKYW